MSDHDDKPQAEVVEGVPPDEAAAATAALAQVQSEGLLPDRAENAAPLSYSTAIQLGHAMAASGFFKDAREPAQAAVKIIVGAELGFGPAASIMNVDIVEGRPALRGRLLGALVKQHPRFDYKVSDWDGEGCTVTIYEDGQALEPSVTFDKDDAKQAGLESKNAWKSYGRKMYFWRALSWAVDMHCPHLLGGLPLTALEDAEAENAPNLAAELAPPQQRPAALADDRAEKLRADLRATFAELKELNSSIMPPGKFNNQVANAEHSHERLEALLDALRDLVETERAIAEGTERLIAEAGQAKSDEVLSATLRMSSRRQVREAIDEALAELDADPIPDADAGESEKGGDGAE